MNRDLGKMYVRLQHWVDLGIEQDIIDMPDHRIEYAPFVIAEFAKGTPRKNVPGAVLERIKTEIMREPQVKQNLFKTSWSKACSIFKK